MWFLTQIFVFVLAIANLAAADSRPHRHKRRTKDEVEIGLRRMRNHIVNLKADAEDILLGPKEAPSKKKQETEEMKQEIHELRSVFDELDTDAQENLIASRLASDLSTAFDAPLTREDVRKPSASTEQKLPSTTVTSHKGRHSIARIGRT